MSPVTVLFLCTGNSARSIMAEAILNSSSVGAGRFRAFSAGSYPDEHIHPLTLETLQKQNMLSEGLHAKSWIEFYGPSAPSLDFVFTVCDRVAAESCPVWPGRAFTAHWGMADPAAVGGSDDEQRRTFLDAFLVLKRRFERLASLSLRVRTRRALQAELDDIGR